MVAERSSMGIAHVYKQVTVPAAATLLLILSLGGCSTAGSSLLDARAEVPGPPQKATTYLPVEVLPPPREQPAMTPDERVKLQKDLTAARDRQTTAGKKPKGPAQVEPVKP
jgi:hypothetical protein